MFQWFRDSEGRLVKVSIPQELDSRLGLNLNPMEPPPEEQQSQQGVERNPNAFRSMRDHIHPPRMSAPSCIVPLTRGVIRSDLDRIFQNPYPILNKNNISISISIYYG